MGTIPGTYISEVDSGSERTDLLVNKLLLPHLAEYEQIMINYETGTQVSSRMVRFTYSNWQDAYPVEIYMNNGTTTLDRSMFTIDHKMGKVSFNFDLEDGDNVQATYCFNYFPFYVLDGFILRAVDTANNGGVGSATDYTIDTMPASWLSIVADLVLSMCMEKLILEYDLWKGRLIFAIAGNGFYEGSDNIVSQLETIKHNSEDRAYKQLENPKFKAPEALATPTDHYYEALLVGSAARYKNGNASYGALRGARFNKIIGITPRR